MLTLHKALEKLNAFKSVAEIVEFLKSEGIKGDKGDCLTCPIAEWLNIVTPDGPTVKVDWDFIQYNCSVVVRGFISRFDDGNYSDLDANAEEL